MKNSWFCHGQPLPSEGNHQLFIVVVTIWRKGEMNLWENKGKKEEEEEFRAPPSYRKSMALSCQKILNLVTLRCWGNTYTETASLRRTKTSHLFYSISFDTNHFPQIIRGIKNPLKKHLQQQLQKIYGYLGLGCIIMKPFKSLPLTWTKKPMDSSWTKSKVQHSQLPLRISNVVR